MQAYPFVNRSIGLKHNLINNVSNSLDCKGNFTLFAPKVTNLI